MSGEEYLESLRDGRQVWINGERVADVTEHLAFRNSVRQIARMYDELAEPGRHTSTDTGNGGYTHPFFKAPRKPEDLRASAAAIATWSRLTYGWMGRSPDYAASFLSTLGSYPDLYAPYQDNATTWHRHAQERIPFVGHALASPPVDRGRGPVGVRDVHLRVESETDRGLVVSGAKTVATGAALTNHIFVGSFAPIPPDGKEFSAVFIVPTDAPGLKVLCRPSAEFTAARCGSPFYYPLSSRFEENDAILVFDRVLVPWENMFCYDVDSANRFALDSGFTYRGLLHGCVRLAVKFDFLCGLLLKGVRMVGTDSLRGVQARLGELIAYRNLFWTCVDSMVDRPVTWADGTVVPNPDACSTYRLMMTKAYPRAREIFLTELGSSMTYTGSHVLDWAEPEVRGHLDRYLRGSHAEPAEERAKLMRLIWDAVGSEFGGRHELYELNYSGNHELIRLQTLQWQQADGKAAQYEQFVDQCLADYSAQGWAS